MSGFEPRISGIGSDRCTNWATTTAPSALISLRWIPQNNIWLCNGIITSNKGWFSNPLNKGQVATSGLRLHSNYYKSIVSRLEPAIVSLETLERWSKNKKKKKATYVKSDFYFILRKNLIFERKPPIFVFEMVGCPCQHWTWPLPTSVAFNRFRVGASAHRKLNCYNAGTVFNGFSILS